jgi:hypothetical protein
VGMQLEVPVTRVQTRKAGAGINVRLAPAGAGPPSLQQAHMFKAAQQVVLWAKRVDTHVSRALPAAPPQTRSLRAPLAPAPARPPAAAASAEAPAAADEGLHAQATKVVPAHAALTNHTREKYEGACRCGTQP